MGKIIMVIMEIYFEEEEKRVNFFVTKISFLIFS